LEAPTGVGRGQLDPRPNPDQLLKLKRQTTPGRYRVEKLYTVVDRKCWPGFNSAEGKFE